MNAALKPVPEVIFEAKTRDGDTWSVVTEADYRRYGKNPDYMVRMRFKEK